MKKRGLILALVMVLVFSLFATSFASSNLVFKGFQNTEGELILDTDRDTGGMSTFSVPPRIIDW